MIFYIATLILYFGFHSILAGKPAKTLWARFFPAAAYRLFYNIFALTTLIPVVISIFKIEKTLWLKPVLILQAIGGILFLTGIFLVKKTMENYDLGEFAGTAQLRSGRAKIVGALNTSGWNAKVRHPLYFASLLQLWGLSMVLPYNVVIIFSLIATIYLITGTQLEEKKLVEDFGDAYKQYRKQVPMLIPRWKDVWKS